MKKPIMTATTRKTPDEILNIAREHSLDYKSLPPIKRGVARKIEQGAKRAKVAISDYLASLVEHKGHSHGKPVR